MIGAALVSVSAAPLVARRFGVEPVMVAALIWGVMVALPATIAVGFMLWAVRRFRRAAAATRRDRAASDASLEAAELIALGLAGGLSIGGAHHLARRHGPAEIAPALDTLADEIDGHGIVVALTRDRSHLEGSSDVLAAAAASGAPVLPALEAFIRQEHHRRHTAAVERARRLPIRLLLPLTLIVLPGFVLITVGPTVVESLTRLTP